MADLTSTPAAIIARLDVALARRGETVTVRRYSGSGEARTPTDVTGCRASFRTTTAEDLQSDSIIQSRTKAVISPTGLSALLPLRSGDKILRGSKEWNIEHAMPITVNDILVRIDLTVSG